MSLFLFSFISLSFPHLSLLAVRLVTLAALLQCVTDTFQESTSTTGEGDAGGAAVDSVVEWGDLSAVSVACVGRHCGAIMKACVGLAWEAKVDVPHWLKELENLKVCTGCTPIRYLDVVFTLYRARCFGSC